MQNLAFVCQMDCFATLAMMLENLLFFAFENLSYLLCR